MKDLKPTVFWDLIAMNALYRPGPLEYIPSFDEKKWRRGNQIRSRCLWGYLEKPTELPFTKSRWCFVPITSRTQREADVCVKQWVRNKRGFWIKWNPICGTGCCQGHDATILEKIWKDWEAFASYAFNKSHSTCYAWIAYQTAYLKAHYPAEYMAAVLSNNMSDINRFPFLWRSKRMGLQVLGPDVNESFINLL
jgi:DNA polymerase-3 subunit alpha